MGIGKDYEVMHDKVFGTGVLITTDVITATGFREMTFDTDTLASHELYMLSLQYAKLL